MLASAGRGGKHTMCGVEGKLETAHAMTFSPKISAKSRQLANNGRRTPDALFRGNPEVKKATVARVRAETDAELTFKPIIRQHSVKLAKRYKARTPQELEARKKKHNPDAGLSTEQIILRDYPFTPEVSANPDLAASHARRSSQSISNLAVHARLALDPAKAVTLPRRTKTQAEDMFRSESPLWKMAKDKKHLYLDTVAQLQHELHSADRSHELDLAMHSVLQLNNEQNPRPPVASALGPYTPPDLIQDSIKAVAFARRIAAQADARYTAAFAAWIKRQLDNGAFVLVTEKDKTTPATPATSATPATPNGNHTDPHNDSFISDTDSLNSSFQPAATTSSSPWDPRKETNNRRHSLHLASLSTTSPLYTRSERRKKELEQHLHARQLEEDRECTFLPRISKAAQDYVPVSPSGEDAAGLPASPVFDRLFLTQSGSFASSARNRRKRPDPIPPEKAFKMYTATEPGAKLSRLIAQKRTILRARVTELAGVPDMAKTVTSSSSSSTSSSTGRYPPLQARGKASKKAQAALAASVLPKIKEVQTLRDALHKLSTKQQEDFKQFYKASYGLTPDQYHARRQEDIRKRRMASAPPRGASRVSASTTRASSASPHERPSRFKKRTTVARAPSFVDTRQARTRRKSGPETFTYQPKISALSRRLAEASSSSHDLTAKRTPEQEKRWQALQAQVEAERMEPCTFQPRVSSTSLELVAKKGKRSVKDMKYATGLRREKTEELARTLRAEEDAICTHAPRVTEKSRALSRARIQRELAEQYGSEANIPDQALHAAVPPTALARYHTKLDQIRAERDRELSFSPAINTVSTVLAERRRESAVSPSRVHDRLYHHTSSRDEDPDPDRSDMFQSFIQTPLGSEKRMRIKEKKRMLASLRKQLQQDLIDSGKGLLYGVILSCVGRKNNPNAPPANPDDDILFERNRDWMQPIVDELAFLERAIDLATSVLRSDFDNWVSQQPTTTRS